jgi:hypothetical protein
MTEALDVSAPLAERPPFDEEQDELLEGDGPTEPVGEVLALAADLGFGPADFIELALCSLAEVAADLTDGLESDEIAADPTTVATLERLQIGAQILSEVTFGDDPEEAEGEEGEAGEAVDAEWEGEEEEAAAA